MTPGVRIVGSQHFGTPQPRALGLNLVGTPGLSPGPIGILSQSGNIALALMNEGATDSQGRSIGLRRRGQRGGHRIPRVPGRAGAEDSGTEVIVMYADGIRATGAFLRTAARITPRKPIVLLKGGRTTRGLDGGALAHGSIWRGTYDCVERRPQAGRCGRSDA